MRKRVGALIVKNKHILLVSQEGTEFYWTPGGTVEKNETDKQTLKRELNEELGVSFKTLKFFARMKYPTDNVVSVYYLVKIIGEPKPSNEISKIIWYSKENYKTQNPRVTPWISKELIPNLIKDKYI